MSKNDYDDFDTLDDYYEDEGDSLLFNQVIESDLSDVSYADFNKVNDYYDDDIDEDELYQETESVHTTKVIKKTKTSTSFEDRLIENESLMGFLKIFWKWFKRLGVVIAVILIAYYLVKGLFKELFAYFILLIIAFFFGFGFMAILTKIKDNQ